VAPGPNDTALFTVNSTVVSANSTLDTAFTVAGVTLDSAWIGTLGIVAPLTITGNYSQSEGFVQNTASFSVAGNFTLNGFGELLPDAAVSIAGSNSSWTGGSILIQSAGTFTNTGTLTINSGGSSTGLLLAGGTFVNSGTVDVAGSGQALALLGGVTLSNTGVIDFTSDAGINVSSGGGTLSNARGATLEKTGGTGTSSIAATVSNTGTLLVNTGTMDITGSVTQVSGTSLIGGSWEVFASQTVPATLDLGSAANLTTIDKGTVVELSGLNSVFTNLGGLNSVAGSFDVLAGATFITGGGLTLNGSGLLDIGAGSTVTTNGNFDLTSTAKLQIGLGGTNSKPTFGQLDVTGTVTLGGKLKFTATSKPAIGSSFEILDNEGTAAISGTFAGLAQGSTLKANGMTFKISYKGGTGNDVTLTRIA